MRAVLGAAQIDMNRKCPVTSAAKQRTFIEAGCGPDARVMVREPVMTLPAGVIHTATWEPNSEHVIGTMVVGTPRLRVDIDSVDG